jgi:hypothetical protein
MNHETILCNQLPYVRLSPTTMESHVWLRCTSFEDSNSRPVRVPKEATFPSDLYGSNFWLPCWFSCYNQFLLIPADSSLVPPFLRSVNIPTSHLFILNVLVALRHFIENSCVSSVTKILKWFPNPVALIAVIINPKRQTVPRNLAIR